MFTPAVRCRAIWRSGPPGVSCGSQGVPLPTLMPAPAVPNPLDLVSLAPVTHQPVIAVLSGHKATTLNPLLDSTQFTFYTFSPFSCSAGLFEISASVFQPSTSVTAVTQDHFHYINAIPNSMIIIRDGDLLTRSIFVGKVSARPCKSFLTAFLFQCYMILADIVTGISRFYFAMPVWQGKGGEAYQLIMSLGHPSLGYPGASEQCSQLTGHPRFPLFPRPIAKTIERTI